MKTKLLILTLSVSTNLYAKYKYPPNYFYKLSVVADLNYFKSTKEMKEAVIQLANSSNLCEFPRFLMLDDNTEWYKKGMCCTDDVTRELKPSERVLTARFRCLENPNQK